MIHCVALREMSEGDEMWAMKWNVDIMGRWRLDEISLPIQGNVERSVTEARRFEEVDEAVFAI